MSPPVVERAIALEQCRVAAVAIAERVIEQAISRRLVPKTAQERQLVRRRSKLEEDCLQEIAALRACSEMAAMLEDLDASRRKKKAMARGRWKMAFLAAAAQARGGRPPPSPPSPQRAAFCRGSRGSPRRGLGRGHFRNQSPSSPFTADGAIGLVGGGVGASHRRTRSDPTRTAPPSFKEMQEQLALEAAAASAAAATAAKMAVGAAAAAAAAAAGAICIEKGAVGVAIRTAGQRAAAEAAMAAAGAASFAASASELSTGAFELAVALAEAAKLVAELHVTVAAVAAGKATAEAKLQLQVESAKQWNDCMGEVAVHVLAQPQHMQCTCAKPY